MYVNLGVLEILSSKVEGLPPLPPHHRGSYCHLRTAVDYWQDAILTIEDGIGYGRAEFVRRGLQPMRYADLEIARFVSQFEEETDYMAAPQ